MTFETEVIAQVERIRTTIAAELQTALAERDEARAYIARMEAPPTIGTDDMPTDPAQLAELWEFMVLSARWQHGLTVKWQAEVAQARAALQRVRDAATAALANWEPERKHYQDRADQKGYSHDETAAAVYGVAMAAMAGIVADLDGHKP